MIDVLKSIESVIATLEALLVKEIQDGHFDEAADAEALLQQWRERHLRALQYREALDQRRRFAEMERGQAQLGGSVFGVGVMARGRSQ